MTKTQKTGLKEKFLRELRNFAVIFLYVWVIDGMFTLYKALILDHPPLSGQGFALLNAFVLGKVILLLEILKLGEIFPTKPPIYRILFKAALFGLLLLAFCITEDAVTGWFHGKTFDASISEIGGGRLEGMLIVAFIMAVALTPYLACKEISRAIGKEKLKRLIFHPPATTDVAPT